MKTLRPALVLLALFTLVTGALYPAVVTGLAQLLFPATAGGSLVRAEGGGAAARPGGQVIGSRLVGQAFADPGHFWSRPSATGAVPYDARASTGSNQGPTSPALLEAVKARIGALRAADPGNTAPVPVDLVTASGSGLDPHLSPAGALYQVGRVARARGLPEERVRRLVEERIEPPWLGLFGAPRVDVQELNRALDALRNR